MDIAALNSRITIQKSTSISDEVGNYSLQWEDYYSCYATISYGSGEEELVGQTFEKEILNFSIRYCQKASLVTPTNFRIVFRGMTYDIKSIDNMGFKKKSLKFRAERERA